MTGSSHGAGTMRAVIISAPFEASLDEIERIPVDPGEILIRCRTAAVCTTERRVFSGHLKYYPAIGGHEFAGVVESVDGADTDLAPGDHVAIDAHNRCGTCHYCVRGRSNVRSKASLGTFRYRRTIAPFCARGRAHTIQFRGREKRRLRAAGYWAGSGSVCTP